MIALLIISLIILILAIVFLFLPINSNQRVGPKGPQGEQGAPGAKGATGPKGIAAPIPFSKVEPLPFSAIISPQTAYDLYPNRVIIQITQDKPNSSLVNQNYSFIETYSIRTGTIEEMNLNLQAAIEQNINVPSQILTNSSTRWRRRAIVQNNQVKWEDNWTRI